ncbi:MAG TPA: YeeE/YedE family protein [Beijerinckiaceae bacterium]|nr:YeeE/YedE family protein [Beijerinckiaceae bacterium]
MHLTTAIEALGENGVSALGGLGIGIVFGFWAQKSRFCLRAAAVEFARGSTGVKVSVWLLVFATALVGTQALIAAGQIDVSETRQLAAQGSISGAALGGLMFGFGMVLARGCASRLLVLSANGNLRALLSGLVFAVAAQASFRGLLAPAREQLTGLWLVDGGPSRDIIAVFGGGTTMKVIFALVWLAAAIVFCWRNRIPALIIAGGIGTGLAVAAGWWFTYALAQSAFSPVPVKSLTFSGPSADVLMFVLSGTLANVNFDIALVPGVFIGSFLAAAFAGELKIEGFTDGLSMRRYIFGATLMGFGAMLAGGCAVGAGVSGASVFALTAWIVLVGMWLGAALADLAFDRPRHAPAVQRP